MGILHDFTILVTVDLRSKNKFYKSLEPDGVHFLSTFDEWGWNLMRPKTCVQNFFLEYFGYLSLPGAILCRSRICGLSTNLQEERETDLDNHRGHLRCSHIRFASEFELI